MLGQESADRIAELFRDPCSIATSESFEGVMKSVPVLNPLDFADDVARPSPAGIRLRRDLAFRQNHNENQEKKSRVGAASAAESPRQYRIPTETTTSCVLTFLLGA
jgi:hypothetical protein